MDYLTKSKDQAVLLHSVLGGASYGDIDERIAEEKRVRRPGRQQSVEKLEIIKRINVVVTKYKTKRRGFFGHGLW